MLAVSCLTGRHAQFLNLEGMKLQPNIKYCLRHNTENDDEETKSLVMALLALVFKNGYTTPESIKEIVLYNAKNKNISKTVKTNEIERFREYFDISMKFGKALKEYSHGAIPDNINASPTQLPSAPANIQSLISAAMMSSDDDFTPTFESSGDSEQDAIQHLLNITLDYDHVGLNAVIRAYMQFDDKDFIIFNADNYDEIKEAAEQFKSLGYHETCTKLGETRGLMAINDKMMFNLKMSLDANVYDSLNRIKV